MNFIFKFYLLFLFCTLFLFSILIPACKVEGSKNLMFYKFTAWSKGYRSFGHF